MFNPISKFMNPDEFMPDAHEITKRASAMVKFQNLTGIHFEGQVTYRDLMSALLMAQRDLMHITKMEDKLAYCRKLFAILDAYIDAQKKLSAIAANEIVICCDNLWFASDYIIDHGSDVQKGELKLIYNKVLDIALRYNESSTNIKNLVRAISDIR